MAIPGYASILKEKKQMAIPESEKSTTLPSMQSHLGIFRNYKIS
jgi:hypothetical protein